MRTRQEIEAEIKDLYSQYKEDCKDEERQCEAEGYPSNGSNYELRCTDNWNRFYAEWLESLEQELAELGVEAD